MHLSLIIVLVIHGRKITLLIIIKVNEIDSIYRIAQRPKLAIKNSENYLRSFNLKIKRIEEFKNYIYLSDKYQKNFGGKKSVQVYYFNCTL